VDDVKNFLMDRENRKDRELLKGAIDLHVHIDPDIKTPHRAQNGYECALAMKEAGMRAVIFKPLGLPSTSMAYMVNLVVDDFLAFGAITLNRCVGGLNPVAVKHALLQGDGAKAVWFPTADSLSHAQFFSRGLYPFVEGYEKGLKEERKKRFQSAYSIIRTKPEEAVLVFKNGALLDAAREILDLVAEAGVILGTGHMPAADADRFIDEAKKAGVKKIVIPHPTWKVMDYSLDDMIKLADKGAYLEHCISACDPQQYVSHGLTPLDPNDFAIYIRKIGAERCLMSTDSGMFSVPVPVESMRVYIALLLDAGISETEIDVMVRKNPAKLLGI
jgi:hypothetical protein